MYRYILESWEIWEATTAFQTGKYHKTSMHMGKCKRANIKGLCQAKGVPMCLMRSRILGKIPGPRYVCTSQVYIFATLSLKVSYHQRECSSNCTNDCVARKKMKFLYLNTNHSPLSLTPDHDCILRNNLEGEPACVLCTHSPICVYQVKFLKRNIPIQCWSPNRACNWKDYASI